MPRKPPETSTADRTGDGRGRAHVYLSDATPEGTFVIDDHATLKVFYDPVRQRVMQTLYTPMSVTELGEAVSESPNRLYYHVRLLEKHGLIVVADERRVGSNVERLYGRAASRYELAPSLVDAGDRLAAPAADDRMNRIFEHYRALLSAAKPSGVPTMVRTLTKQVAPQRVGELNDKLSALLEEYLGPDAPSDDDGVRYAALVITTPDAVANGAGR